MFCALRLYFLAALFYLPAIASQELPGLRQSGAGTRTISGSVVLRGTNLSSVRVTIQSSTRSFQRIAYADGSGSFTIGSVPVGQHLIVLEAEGYLTLSEGLDVPPGTGPMMVQYVMQLAPPTRTSSPKEPLVSVPSLKVPEDAKKELEAGMRKMRDKQGAEARKHFEKALRKHPEFPQVLHALAVLDAGEQQEERAVGRLRRAVEIDPSYAEGYVTLSRVLNLLGRHAEALDVARQGLELQPALWQGHYELGLAALSLGREELALESVARIEALAGPKTPELRLLRSGVLLKRLKFAEAKAELLVFLELAPDHAFAGLARQTLRDIDKKLSSSVP